MTTERERVSLADLLGIQVLRRLDAGEPGYCADIDGPLSADAPRDHRGHLKHPIRVLADRADLVLQTRHGVSAGWLGEVVSWLRVFRILGYLSVLVIAFGLAEPWLRQGEVVNVEWIFGFLATLVISMTITSLLMILAIFAKRKPEDSTANAATQSFAKLLIVHWIIQFVIRRAVPWIERRILKRSGDKSPEEIKRIEHVTECLYDTLSRQSRRTALEAAATSNTVWFLLSIGVLLSLGKMGLFREYDFRWQATIVSEEFMRDATVAMAAPLRGFPLVSQPDAADVRWLATGELSETDDQANPEASHQNHRQLWGRLFLAYLLYYGVLPRFVLMVISRWLAARGWKGLRPNLKDAYFKTIIANIETPPFESTLEEQESEAGGQGPEVEGERGGVSPPVPLIVPATREDQEADDSRSPEEIPIGTNTVVFSYDVQEPNEGWPKALAMAGNGSVINLGNAGDRAGRKRATTELCSHRDEVGLLVIVANLVDNPDGLFEHFIRETIGQLHPKAGRSMVLVGGERLRQRFEGDARKISDRIELWKHKGMASGIEREKILEFDIEHATTAARELLRERMQAFQPSAKEPGQQTAGLQSAGLFRKATTVVIMSHIHEDTARQSAEQLRETTLTVHQQLRSLYQKQASALDKAFAHVKIDTGRIRSAVSDKAHFAAGQLDRLEEFSRMTAVIGRYTKGLSGKWAIGGGLVCALGSGALAVLAAPALLPALIPAAALGAQAGVLGGVLSAHAPHLAAKLRFRKDKPEDTADEAQEEHPEDSFALEDLVRSSTLLALILELQGNSEDRIARALEAILENDSETNLTTPETCSRWLSEVTKRTEEYLAKNG